MSSDSLFWFVMNWFRSPLLFLRVRRIMVVCLLILVSGVVFGAYRPGEETEPIVRAILWGTRNARAWVDFQGMRFHLGKGMRLDDEWRVEDIRRENVLFKKVNAGLFVEIPLVTKEKPKYNRDWSFWGDPLGLWEAIEMLATGFGYGAVMHTQAGGAVTPRNHADNLENMMLRILPNHHRFVIAGPVLLVMPVHPEDEDWQAVLNRMKKRRPEDLTTRFAGMRKPGSLCSRGDDIQMVLRQIALGSGVPIAFPRDLHFPVYATFSHIPFCQILVKITYLNQCFVIEREAGLEVQPWPRHLQPMPIPPVPEMAVAGVEEPQQGFGPSPPPIGPLAGPPIPPAPVYSSGPLPPLLPPKGGPYGDSFDRNDK